MLWPHTIGKAIEKLNVTRICLTMIALTYQRCPVFVYHPFVTISMLRWKWNESFFPSMNNGKNCELSYAPNRTAYPTMTKKYSPINNSILFFLGVCLWIYYYLWKIADLFMIGKWWWRHVWIFITGLNMRKVKESLPRWHK